MNIALKLLFSRHDTIREELGHLEKMIAIRLRIVRCRCECEFASSREKARIIKECDVMTKIMSS